MIDRDLTDRIIVRLGRPLYPAAGLEWQSSREIMYFTYVGHL